MFEVTCFIGCHIRIYYFCVFLWQSFCRAFVMCLIWYPSPYKKIKLYHFLLLMLIYVIVKFGTAAKVFFFINAPPDSHASSSFHICVSTVHVFIEKAVQNIQSLKCILYIYVCIYCIHSCMSVLCS